MSRELHRYESNSPDGAVPCLSLRLRDAAAAIGVSDRTLWQWTQDSSVPHVRINKVVLYPVDALRDWLNRQAASTIADKGVAK